MHTDAFAVTRFQAFSTRNNFDFCLFEPYYKPSIEIGDASSHTIDSIHKFTMFRLSVILSFSNRAVLYVLNMGVKVYSYERVFRNRRLLTISHWSSNRVN
jgi:hypothetical protein